MTRAPEYDLLDRPRYALAQISAATSTRNWRFGPLQWHRMLLSRCVRKYLTIVALCTAGFAGILSWAGYFSSSPFTLVIPTKQNASGGTHIAAIYISGDVGYKIATGKQIGDRLSNDGIPVLAVNSLSFFRAKRTIPEVTALIEQAIAMALHEGHSQKVVLIGHSLGADALQAGLAALPANFRAKIEVIVLIAPTSTLYLQISPFEMLEWSEPDAATMPTLKQIDWVSLTCISGTEEDASPCPRLFGTNIKRVVLPGGHNLNWDSDAVHRVILGAMVAAMNANVTKSSRHSPVMSGQARLQNTQ